MRNISMKEYTLKSKNVNYSRVVGLDLLRISLALLIFLFHSHIHILKCDYGIMNGFISMGAIAMTGFFLLSGYTLNLNNREVAEGGGKKHKKVLCQTLNFHPSSVLCLGIG